MGMTGKERKGFFQCAPPHFPPAELLFRHFGQECHKGPKNLHNLEFVRLNSFNVNIKVMLERHGTQTDISDICTMYYNMFYFSLIHYLKCFPNLLFVTYFFLLLCKFYKDIKKKYIR